MQNKKSTLKKTAPLCCAVCFCLSMAAVTTAMTGGYSNADAVATADDKLAATTVGEGSSVRYGRNEQYDDVGLTVSLAQNDTVRFNGIIDVSECVKSGEPLVELYATPTRKGKEEYRRLYMTFTDVSDEDASVTVLLRNYPDAKYSILSAAANGQNYTSWQWYDDMVFSGEESWHTPLGINFLADYSDPDLNLNSRDPKDNTFKLWYEAESKQIYYDNLDPGMLESRKKMLIDLDDSRFFGTLFGGFPSGRVKLSIRADEYLGSGNAEFMIKRIGDFDLTSEIAEYGVDPTITLDLTQYGIDLENLPHAKVGATYAIPTATAADGALDPCKVDVKVTYSATDDGEKSDIAINGNRFATANGGFYNIVYTATDPTGRTAERMLTVTTADVDTPTLNVAAVAGQCKAGVPLTVPAATVSENSSLDVKATLNGKTIEINDDTILPLETGECRIVYTLTDVRGQTASVTRVATVVANDIPTVIDAPALPDVFISGSRYILPALTAYTFDASGKKAATTTIKATDMRGGNAVAAGAVYIPYVENNGDVVRVSYMSGDTEVYGKDIPCVKAYSAVNSRMRLSIENFFMTNGMTFEKDDLSMTCISTEDNASFVFARALKLNEFTLDLGTLPERSDYDSIEIKLIDSVDPGRTVSCYLDREAVVYPDGYTEYNGFLRYGSVKVDLGSAFLCTGKGGSASVGYQDGSWLFSRNYSVGIKKYDNGEKFDGLSDFVYLKVSLIGGKAGAAYTVSDICGQSISANPQDSISPVIEILGDFGGTTKIGEAAVVRKATAFDVLDPYTNLTVTVTAPDGNVVTSSDGVELLNVKPDREYSFVPQAYGNYSVAYKAYDGAGNLRQVGYSVIVRDDVPPEISFASDPPSSCKVGEAFAIPDAVVTDNKSAVENISTYVTVYAPNTAMTLITGKTNGYIPKQAGIYRVSVTAYDEAGNVTVKSFDVNVTE